LKEEEISELYRLVARLKDSVQSVSQNGAGQAAAEETRK
jgi:hypothetical protein